MDVNMSEHKHLGVICQEFGHILSGLKQHLLFRESVGHPLVPSKIYCAISRGAWRLGYFPSGASLMCLLNIVR